MKNNIYFGQENLARELFFPPNLIAVNLHFSRHNIKQNVLYILASKETTFPIFLFRRRR